MTSGWRVRMKEADDARKVLINDRLQGEEEFKRLLGKYGNDPMIFFKRGEAFEAIREWDLALGDYKQAAAIFPLPRWKDLATKAVERVQFLGPNEKAISAGDLDKMRRDLIRILNSLDKGNNQRGEKLAERVTRLQRTGLIPPNIANCMHTLLRFRNEATYGGAEPSSGESEVAKAAWKVISDWSR